MCLATVSKNDPNASTVIVDGWKLFKGSGKSLRFPSYSHNGKTEVPLDTWIAADLTQASRGKIRSDDGKTYEAGFHAYAEEKQKPSNATRRVYLRRITTVGTQNGFPIIVAQEMFVPSDSNAWPPQPATPPVGEA